MGVTVRFEKRKYRHRNAHHRTDGERFRFLYQQESLSISANQRLSYQHRMEQGLFIACTAPYGYRMVDKKNLEVIPEEADVVRWIFSSYLKGPQYEMDRGGADC